MTYLWCEEICIVRQPSQGIIEFVRRGFGLKREQLEMLKDAEGGRRFRMINSCREPAVA